MRGECIQWRDVNVAVAAKLEVRISPVLRPPPPLGGHGLPAPSTPGSLPPAPASAWGSWLTSQGGGVPSLPPRTAPAQPAGFLPGSVTPRPSQHRPPHTHTPTQLVPSSLRGGSLERGQRPLECGGQPRPRLGPRATRHIGCPTAPAWGGGHLSRAPEELGNPRKDKRSGGGTWHKSFRTSAEEP